METRLEGEKNLDISIIIRTLNEGKHIGRLLNALFKQKISDNLEIIIVDSGSKDHTLDIIKNYPTKVVNINQEDFSFGYALNTGIKHSRGKYLVFISAHCYPAHDNWLNILLEPFKRDEKVVIVYGKQRGNELTKFSEQQIFKEQFPAGHVNIEKKVPFCNNANSAISRLFWEKQPFDEQLSGLEDVDLANKALKQGYKVCYNPQAGVIHVHEEDWSDVFRRYQREAIALEKIFFQARFSFFDFIKLFVVNTCLDWFRSILFDRRSNNIWEIPCFRIAQFWGMYRGYNFKQPFNKDVKKYFYYYHPFKKDK